MKEPQHTARLHFQPLDYVIVTMLGVGYRGRVNKVFVYSERPEDNLYEVQFAKDNGELTMLTFRHDELALTKGPKGFGFAPEA